MRYRLSLVVGLACWTAFGQAQAAAQPQTPPTIHRVTVQPDTGVLTISGTGLSADLMVMVEGQRVTVLPGATDTQLEVVAPVTVLMTPGTYRLAVVDPTRQVGDGFVVASPAGAVTTSTFAASAGVGPPARNSAAAVGARAQDDDTSSSTLPAVTESDCVTAVGRFALVSATVPWGCESTAVGRDALRFNTAGYGNTAIGATALRSNTTAFYNTATGLSALSATTTGSYNTATGMGAMTSNTTGEENTASGMNALGANVSGYRNTATGFGALRLNTSGFENTSTGAYALYSNSLGIYNVATGTRALAANNGGSSNSAHGVEALLNNISGWNNTADGQWALLSNTSGAGNTGIGFNAGANATTGNYNVFLGADVVGTAADANTMRLGLPYDSGTGAGQSRTFIAGIHGTQLTGPAVQVFVDANGQLGTLTAPVATGTISGGIGAAGQAEGEALATIAALRRQVEQLQATDAELRARLAKLEAHLQTSAAALPRR
jgi:hypothetical protein